MSRMSFLSAFSLAVAIFAVIWLRRSPHPPAGPLIPGRNNTVLFLTAEPRGLANVHIATSFALAVNHPSLDVHYASFIELGDTVKQTSNSALAKNPSARQITWHEISGPGVEASFYRVFGNSNGMVEEPGAKGMAKKINDVKSLLTSWTAEEHWAIHKRLIELIDEVDPSVIIIDHVFKPASDLVGNVNRRIISISPNILVDLIADRQPWGGMFWKYPA